MTKDELQGTASHVLAKNHRLMCMWATGTGKTNVALNFIKSNPGMNVLIFVPETDNIKNWEYEFNKFNAPIHNVTISCYASMHKYQDTQWDFIVFDEAPHADTPLKRELLATIKADWVLALGAVLTSDEIDALEYTYGEFYKSRISLDKAIEKGWLPLPTVNVCHLVLDDKHLNQWYRGRVYTAAGLYKLLCDKVDAAVKAHDDNPTKFTERRMYNAGIERKRFLGEQKEEAIKRLCADLEIENKRFLCFCSSIKQAERIGGENAYTSKTSKSAKLLDRFNNHEINSLFVVAKLIEGQNLNDIECGIIGQIGGTERITVQALGRILRAENPVVYIPVFDGTKDDSFLWTLTNNVSENYIQHCNF